MQSILICIQTGKTVNDSDKLGLRPTNFTSKAPRKCTICSPSPPDACERTPAGSPRCSFDFEFGVTKLPYFEAPDGMENQAYFEKLCYGAWNAATAARQPTRCAGVWNTRST